MDNNIIIAKKKYNQIFFSMKIQLQLTLIILYVRTKYKMIRIYRINYTTITLRKVQQL